MKKLISLMALTVLFSTVSVAHAQQEPKAKAKVETSDEKLHEAKVKAQKEAKKAAKAAEVAKTEANKAVKK
jgi:hypothetical protein